MKNNELNQLLEKYREGTLSDGELAELNRLSGRDEVTAAADSTARGIVRRRTRIGAGLAMVAIIVAGAVLWLPSGNNTQQPLVAEAAPQKVIADEETALPIETVQLPVETPVQVAAIRKPAVKQRVPDEGNAGWYTDSPASETQPVVICNNQCEADSVISEIRKFLAV